MNNVDREVYNIAIGALMHDIGKFYQRAYGMKESVLSPSSRNMDSYLCPKNNYSNYTHRHSLWTLDFFEKSFLKIPKGLDHNKIRDLASYHHKPSNFEQKIIQQADILSSGMERMEDDTDKGICSTPLISIFSHISVGLDKPVEEYCHSLSPLRFDKSIFPRKKNEVVVNSSMYKKLWLDFVKEASNLYHENPKIYIGALLSLLKKYTWCIPSAVYKAKPDIPLLDHLHTTSALAVCLYLYHKEKGKVRDWKTPQEKQRKKFLLISGDVSGIQSFIFGIKQEGSKKGVAKVLRGRSLFVILMTASAVHYLLDELGLPPTNKIIDAGGRFTIIAPNTSTIKEKVSKVRENIEKYCLKEFGGQLVLNIDEGMEVSYEDLLAENYKDMVSRLMAYSMEKKKKSPLISAFADEESFVLKEKYKSLQFSNKVCVMCGHEPASEEAEDDRGNICEKAYSLGDDLPDAKFLVYKHVKEHEPTNFWYKYRVDLYKGGKPNINENVSYVERINDLGEILYPVVDLSNYSTTYTSEDIDEIDEDPYEISEEERERIRIGGIKSFNHISKKSKGANLLGIFKADLDNMGFIFRKGFKTDVPQSLSRTVALSRCINFFFTSYLRKYLEENFPNTYTLFSGGDDLCLIGPWNEMIDLALSLQEEFFEYAAENPHITMSAGLCLVKPRHPAGKAIKLSEELLEYSKKEGKNRITLFKNAEECSASWDEIKVYIDYKNRLRKYIGNGENKVISSSNLYRFLEYFNEYKSFKKGKMGFKEERKATGKRIVIERGALWRSHFIYDISRNILPRAKKEQRGELGKIFEFLIKQDTESGMFPMKKLPLVLFPLIYELRK